MTSDICPAARPIAPASLVVRQVDARVEEEARERFMFQSMFQMGYADALKNGHKNVGEFAWRGPSLLGFQKGICDLYMQIPPPVGQLVHALISFPALQISFDVPPLPSASRRAVYLLLAHEMKTKRVKVSCQGDKSTTLRGMRVASIRPKPNAHKTSEVLATQRDPA